MAVSRTRARDLIDSSHKGHVAAQVNCCREEIGRRFDLELGALEIPLELSGGAIGLDESRERHDDFKFWFVFPGCHRKVNSAHASFNISRANGAAGAKCMKLRRMPVACGRRPVVKVHKL